MMYDTVGPPTLLPLATSSSTVDPPGVVKSVPSLTPSVGLLPPGVETDDRQQPPPSYNNVPPHGVQPSHNNSSHNAPPPPHQGAPPPPGASFIPPPPFPPIITKSTSNDFEPPVSCDDFQLQKEPSHLDANNPSSSSPQCGEEGWDTKKKKRKFDSLDSSYRSGSHSPASGPSSASASPGPHTTQIVTPNKDLESVIDRLAVYVVKNGEEFEDGIKEKKDARFDFLLPSNIYHPYYMEKKREAAMAEEEVKRKEEERKKNLKVKFGVKSKLKPVTVATKKKKLNTTASVFNQNDEDNESEGGEKSTGEGFQPNSDTEVEVKRKLQKQIEEKEKLLRQLHEQALLQQKIAEVNKQASAKTTQQQTQTLLMQNKIVPKESSSTTTATTSGSRESAAALAAKQDERKRRAATFVGRLKKGEEAAEEGGGSSSSAEGSAGNFLRKKPAKEGPQDDAERAAYVRKKDAFFQAINNAFKGGT